MTLAALKEEAAKILAIPETVGEFENRHFNCRSGGSPRNDVGVPEVHRSDEFAYSTNNNGPAYYGHVTVLCKDTGAKDSKGRVIYITPCGKVFVFRYSPGSLYNFDSGILIAPVMA